MSDDEGPSRRQLLRQLAGVGAVGATAGVGTRALVTESESFVRNSLQSRSLDLEVARKGSDSSLSTWEPQPSAFHDASGVTVDVDGLAPGESRSLAVGVRNRPCDLPVELWLRVAGSGDSTLASVVRMRVVLHDECGTAGGFDWEGTVADLLPGATTTSTDGGADLGSLSTGALLAADCNRAASGCLPETCLTAEWWIPDDVDVPAVDDGRLPLSFEFVGRQCTAAEATGGNPWNS